MGARGSGFGADPGGARDARGRLKARYSSSPSRSLDVPEEPRRLSSRWKSSAGTVAA